MGKIHEVQAELIERIKERDIARRQLERAKEDTRYERELNKKLRAELAARPISPRPDWIMPMAHCTACGAAIQQTAYYDVDEIYFDFAEYCYKCGAIFDFEDHSERFEWPFGKDDLAWPSDLEAIGFEVV